MGARVLCESHKRLSVCMCGCQGVDVCGCIGVAVCECIGVCYGVRVRGIACSCKCECAYVSESMRGRVCETL